MTYGETGALLRAAMTTLLRHRQAHLQTHIRRTEPIIAPDAGPEQRADLGAQIRRYRHGILTWCHLAAVAAEPRTSGNYLDTYISAKNRTRYAGPFDHLRTALRTSMAKSSASLPTLEELATPLGREPEEIWRHAARAAALGEHDFDAGLGQGALSFEQSMTLVSDVATIVQALVVLDRRYVGTPGWENLPAAGRLGWSALTVAMEANLVSPDYSIDTRGWRPPLQLIRGPASPGIQGVLEAEHNLLVRLRATPSITNLRRAVESQHHLSGILAAHVTSEPVQEKWRARAQTHGTLLSGLRNLGGVGYGSHGTRISEQAAHVLHRLSQLPRAIELDAKLIAGFDRRFDSIDTRIADHLEEGLRENRIYRRVQVPRIDTDSPGLVKPVRERFTTIDSPGDLLTFTRTRLRPHNAQPDAVRPRGLLDRTDLLNAMVDRPPSHTPGLNL